MNPCPVGMGPGPDGSHCEKLCRTTADCPEGDCRAGLCDSWPRPDCERSEAVEGCTKPDGRGGFRCQKGGPCFAHCKRGLVLDGGTHCVKRCRGPADCPGGECTRFGPPNEGYAICTPVCPSEGCPYPWE